MKRGLAEIFWPSAGLLPNKNKGHGGSAMAFEVSFVSPGKSPAYRDGEAAGTGPLP